MRGARTDVASLLGVETSADPKAALDRPTGIPRRQAVQTTVETTPKRQLDNPQVLQAKLDDAHKQVDLGVARFGARRSGIQRGSLECGSLAPTFTPDARA